MDLTEYPPTSEDPLIHATGEEPYFSVFLIPPPPLVGPPLAFASGAGPQEADNTIKVNQASSAKYVLKV